MTVKFYNLKINPNNRFYDKTAYDNNLIDSNVVFSYELNRDIVPNQVFYIGREGKELLTQLMGCTYITYEINETKFGGFITGVQLLAPKGKAVAITHSVDWWYFVHENEIDFDFHGNCTRAHVNDIDENKYFTMDNTVSTQEAPLSDYKTINEIIDLTENEGLIVNNSRNSNFCFLYMFVNEIPQNWSAPEEIIEYSQKMVNDVDVLPSNGYTFLCAVAKNEGFLYPIVEDSSVESFKSVDFKNVKVKDLQSSTILNYAFSDYFFTDNYNLTIQRADNGSYFMSHTSEDLQILHFKIPDEVNKGLPQFLSYQFSNVLGILGSCFLAQKKIVYNDICNSRVYTQNTQKTTYEEYLTTSIGKFFFEPYQKIVLNENQLFSSKMKDTYITINLTADLLNYIVCIDNKYYKKTFVFRNSSYFTPDTVNDFWTEQNAKLTSISAKQIKVQSKQSYVSSIKKGVNAAIAPLTNFAKGVASGDVLGGTIKAAESLVDAPFSMAESIYQREQAHLLEQQSNVMGVIADRQLSDGDISSEICSSYYSSLIYNKSVYIFSVSATPLKNLELLKDLHRFGYFTFLQLDEIYKNHKREHFNYFQASDIEVTGLPLFMATDIQNMFLSGVHLWQRDIEEFENGTNYQIGLWEETT